ncbi:MAG: hypothetical protein AAGF23_15735, partial [Acidobacteriota bacterium]
MSQKSDGNGQKKSGDGWGRRNRQRSRSSLFAAGEPMVWLTGGALAICALMVAGLLLLVLARGLSTFWPRAVVHVETPDGRVYMGEVTRDDTYKPGPSIINDLEGAIAENARRELAENDGWAFRKLLRTGNFKVTQNHFAWVNQWEVAESSKPDWAMVVERMEWGVFYGMPKAFLELTPVNNAEEAQDVAARLRASAGDAEVKFLSGEAELVDDPASASNLEAVALVYSGPEAAWAKYNEHHDPVREKWEERRRLEKHDTGAVNYKQEKARLAIRGVELELRDAEGPKRARLEAQLAEAQAEFDEIK